LINPILILLPIKDLTTLTLLSAAKLIYYNRMLGDNQDLINKFGGIK